MGSTLCPLNNCLIIDLLMLSGNGCNRSPKRPYRLWNQTNLLCSGYRWVLSLAVKWQRYESARVYLISSGRAQGHVFLLFKLNNNDTNPIIIIIINFIKAGVETNKEIYVKAIYDD